MQRRLVRRMQFNTIAGEGQPPEMNRQTDRENRMSNVLALEITFRISTAHRVEFLQTLEGLLSEDDVAAKNAAVTCFEQVGEDNTFLWREFWDSQDELEDRLHASAIQTLMGAIGVLGDLERIEVLALSSRSRSKLVWT